MKAHDRIEAGSQSNERDPKPVSRYHVEWLSVRLMEAETLLKRGVKMLNRPSWKRGETDDEWRTATEKYLNSRKMEEEYERAALSKPATEPDREAKDK